MSDKLQSLVIYVDPGNASPELIAELFIALNALYVSMGGSGLKIVTEPVKD
jgi:hypothetical protein